MLITVLIGGSLDKTNKTFLDAVKSSGSIYNELQRKLKPSVLHQTVDKQTSVSLISIHYVALIQDICVEMCLLVQHILHESKHNTADAPVKC